MGQLEVSPAQLICAGRLVFDPDSAVLYEAAVLKLGDSLSQLFHSV